MPHSSLITKRHLVTGLVMSAVACALALMAGCAKPQSVSSVSGTYSVAADAMLAESGYDLGDVLSDAELGIELRLDEDGKGTFGTSDGSESKSLKWSLSGSSKNLDIMISLNEPISKEDKWVAFLGMLEDDPSHTKIKGKVTDGEIRINQKEPDKPAIIFSKDGPGNSK